MGVSCRISEEERRKRLERLRGLMNNGVGNIPFPEPVKKKEMLVKKVIKKF